MTYSCTDFTDSILDALNIDVPEEFHDSPEEQADLALAAIERLETATKVLLGIRTDNPEFETGAAVDHADVTARLARRWPEMCAALEGVPMIPADAPSPGIDWRAVAQDLAGALSSCTHQIGQMDGMFDDDDGTIAGALSDAESAMSIYAKAGKIAPGQVGFDAGTLTDGQLTDCLEVLRKRGYAVAAYGYAELGEGPLQDHEGGYDEAHCKAYMAENREGIEDAMSSSVWKYCEGDPSAEQPAATPASA